MSKLKFIMIVVISILIPNLISTNESESKFNLKTLEKNSEGLFKMFLPLLRNKNKFLAPASYQSVRYLNISDFSINAILSMAQRSSPLEMTFKNSTDNTLPINIDTNSLNIIIDELKQFPQNLNMTLTIKENSQNYSEPRVVTDLDGIMISLQVGLDFGLFNVNQEITENSEIFLSLDLNLKIKVQIEINENKLSLILNSISVPEINIKNNLIGVDKNNLQTNLKNFLKAAIQGERELLSDIDILGMLNTFSGMNFTNLEVVTDYGYTLLNIK